MFAAKNATGVTEVPRGESVYATPGTYTWVCPAGVTSVSVVCVGGGGGSLAYPGANTAGSGGGGALAYANNISVTPGTSYTIVVGAGGYSNGTTAVNGGQSSAFGRIAPGGYSWNTAAPLAPSGNVGTSRGGGSGGYGRYVTNEQAAGGAGAGGYSGNGGDANGQGNATNSGTGGGGGSGYANVGAGGGGVGLFGQGTSGAGGSDASVNNAAGGRGGSGGENGAGQMTAFNTTLARGGSFGGGAGAVMGSGGGVQQSGAGGAVRIIWPGDTRQFPSTDVGTP